MRSSHRKRKSVPLIVKTAELGFAAPQVVAHRVARMLIGGFHPTARDRREYRRMGAEKVTAFMESWNGMALEALRVNAEMTAIFMRSVWVSPLAYKRGAAMQMHSATLGVLDKGLDPVHRRAVANARRLAATRLR
jgi:hypothetical protein